MGILYCTGLDDEQVCNFELDPQTPLGLYAELPIFEFPPSDYLSIMKVFQKTTKSVHIGRLHLLLLKRISYILCLLVGESGTKWEDAGDSGVAFIKG